MRSAPALLALSIGAFGIGLTEFSPMGLLPQMAADLGVSIPVAGLLVSAYAFGVVVGAPLMTLTTGRVPRKLLLIGLMGIFTLGNLISALAGSYEMLLIGRVVTSFNHGAFFGVGSVVAASIVPKERQAAAVAAMFMGLSIANVVGVPLTPWIGENAGWRAVFWGITVLGMVAMAALWLAIPEGVAAPNGTMRSEVGVLRKPEVLGALALTVLSSSAMFTVFTYIAPILTAETQATTGFVTAMLVVYGLGLVVGNWLGGRFGDRSIDGTLIVTLVALTALLLVFAVTMRSPVPAALSIFAWGVASFAIVPPLQMRVMKAAAEAPNFAASMNIAAFNLGNAIGAALGGAVIGLRLGYPAVSVAGAAMSGAALVLVLLARRRGQPKAQLSAC